MLRTKEGGGEAGEDAHRVEGVAAPPGIRLEGFMNARRRQAQGLEYITGQRDAAVQRAVERIARARVDAVRRVADEGNTGSAYD